jgi:hypothetical protein
MMKMPKKEEVLHELGNLAAVAAGFVAGNVAANLGDKAMKIDDTSNVFKKCISGGVLTLGGAVGAVMVKNQKGRLLSAGLGASGALHLAKRLAPKATILQGLGEPEETIGLTPISSVSQIPSWRYQASEQSYRPNLPDLGVGMIMPPASSDGYYVDASTNEAALRGTDDNMQGVEDAIIL